MHVWHSGLEQKVWSPDALAERAQLRGQLGSRWGNPWGCAINGWHEAKPPSAARASAEPPLLVTVFKAQQWGGATDVQSGSPKPAPLVG